jgi:hypothetical protein
MDKSEEYTIDKKLDYLTRVMRETAEQIVPKRLIRLDGFLMQYGIFDLTSA